MSANSATQDVQKNFGAVAAAYATSSVHASGQDLADLVKAANLTGQERALDMGCGAGHTALALARQAASVVAVDVTPEMLDVAAGLARDRGLANIAFEQADVTALPFPNADFDLVTSRLSAHHYAEPQRALTEAFRVLRPGGRFLLVDTVAPEDAALDTFCNTFELLRDSSHVRNCRASEWVRMLRAAGFENAFVLNRYAVPIDGDSWVKRMQTPATKVAMLRQLFAEANEAQRAAFELRDDPWGLSIPFALISARKPA